MVGYTRHLPIAIIVGNMFMALMIHSFHYSSSGIIYRRSSQPNHLLGILGIHLLKDCACLPTVSIVLHHLGHTQRNGRSNLLTILIIFHFFNYAPQGIDCSNQISVQVILFSFALTDSIESLCNTTAVIIDIGAPNTEWVDEGQPVPYSS